MSMQSAGEVEDLLSGADFHRKQQNSERGMIAASAVPPAPTFALIEMLSLIESRRQKIAELCRHYQVKRLDVFGSAARGDYHQGTSDIDLLVEFDQVASSSLFDVYFGLREKLSELLACPIDLVMASAVRNPYVKQSIESDRASIYAA